MRDTGVVRAWAVAATLAMTRCGGGGEATKPVLSPGNAVPSFPPQAPSGSVATPGAIPPGAIPPGGPTTPGAPIEMRSPAPSAMQAELRALALDPGNLPPIEKLDAKALRGVMKLIARSLGAKCGDCHTEGDFASPTPRKRVAAKMWDEFVVKLAFSAHDSTDGSPLFCDSCHQGRRKWLDRTDKKALSKWMDANFVDGLKRKDERDHGCETCHVDMEMHFVSRWAEAP
jgi:Cytochrome c7 and related cytochrome c